MRVCSILLLSLLFFGCGKKNPPSASANLSSAPNYRFVDVYIARNPSPGPVGSTLKIDNSVFQKDPAQPSFSFGFPDERGHDYTVKIQRKAGGENFDIYDLIITYPSNGDVASAQLQVRYKGVDTVVWRNEGFCIGLRPPSRKDS